MNLIKILVLAMLMTVAMYPSDSSLMKVKFTNLKCLEHDAKYFTYKRCELKALARDTVGMNVYLQLHKPIKDDLTVNAAFFLKGNGYRPHMYNNTMQLCSFLKNLNRHMFWKIIYEATKRYTNVNHSCPYKEDLIVDGLILNGNMLKLIPFSTNSYMISFRASVDNAVRAEMQVYFQIYD